MKAKVSLYRGNQKLIKVKDEPAVGMTLGTLKLGKAIQQRLQQKGIVYLGNIDQLPVRSVSADIQNDADAKVSINCVDIMSNHTQARQFVLHIPMSHLQSEQPKSTVIRFNDEGKALVDLPESALVLVVSGGQANNQIVVPEGGIEVIGCLKMGLKIQYDAYPQQKIHPVFQKIQKHDPQAYQAVLQSLIKGNDHEFFAALLEFSFDETTYRFDNKRPRTQVNGYTREEVAARLVAMMQAHRDARVRKDAQAVTRAFPKQAPSQYSYFDTEGKAHFFTRLENVKPKRAFPAIPEQLEHYIFYCLKQMKNESVPVLVAGDLRNLTDVLDVKTGKLKEFGIEFEDIQPVVADFASKMEHRKGMVF